MTDRYTDENGQPRFGVRVSPEELERIRREQGIEPPAGSGPAGSSSSSADAAASSVPPVPVSPQAAGSGVSQQGAPRPAASEGAAANQPRYGQAAPSGQAGAQGAPVSPTQPVPDGPGRGTASSPEQSVPAGYPAGRTDSGLASPPPGGWSWQREPGGRRRGSQYQAGAGQQAAYGPGGDGRGWGGAQPTSVYGPGQPGWSGEGGTGGGRRRHRWRMLVIGLILLTLVPAVMTVTAVARVVDGSMTSAGVLASDGQVYLDEGQHVGLYATASDASIGQCEVRAPSGADVDLVTLDERLGISDEVAAAGAASGEAVVPPYASLTAPETGTYTVTCPGGSQQGIVVGPALNVDKAMGSGWLMLGAFLSGIVGFVLTIVGIVRVVRRR